MPPREPELPEGTDHVVRGASRTDGGFVATGGGGDTGGTDTHGADGGGNVGNVGNGAISGTDRLVSQVRDQVTSLRGQAGERLRGFADDGKSRATGLLDDFSQVIDDAARSVDERFGDDYGDYAHRAAGAVSSFADRMRTKTVDDLVDDTRDFIRKSPGIAIGIAAVAGFALVRVIKTGLDDVRERRGSGSGGG